MKGKIISGFFLLAMMAFLPFISINFVKGHSLETAKPQTNTKSEKTKDTNDILTGLVAAKYKDNYCDETLKAITIILNTNYKVNQKLFDLTKKEDYLSEKDFNNSFNEQYDKIRTIVNSVNETTIVFNNKLQIIPYSETSNGKTITDKNYEYISAVASPWDCYLDTYNENNHCLGVSLSGLNYLCNNGFNYKKALLWYLPDCTINE